MNHACVFEVDIGVSHGHAGEIRVHHDALGAAKRAVQRDVAVGIGMAAEILQVQSGEQERIQVDVLDGNLSVQVVRLSQSERITAGYFSRGHGGGQLEMRGGAI